jgi:plastocyanin
MPFVSWEIIMNIRNLFVRCVAAAVAVVSMGPAWSANHNVTVGGAGLVFTPNQLNIAVGDTITFTNAGGLHNVVSNDAGFRCATSCQGNGGNVNTANWVATVTFNTAGTFNYFCDAHGGAGFGMAGTVTVTGTPTPPTLSSGYTGTWYDPTQSGHGIFIEILPGNTLLAYWFTFTPDGQQAWFGGVGGIVNNTATMTAVRTTGARFIPNFNPTEAVRADWGTLTFTFTDCTHGRVDFNSVAGFGTGSMNLTRLTLPAGLTCTNPPAATVTASAHVVGDE